METTDLQIAIIGAGNMGGAIARGLSRGKLIQSKNIRISDVSQKNLDAIKAFAPEITVSNSNREIIKDANIIILAVKPWLVESIADEFDNNIPYNTEYSYRRTAKCFHHFKLQCLERTGTIDYRYIL